MLLVGLMAPAAFAWGEGITPPPTPPAITPPSGNIPFLLGHATGTQGYLCLPTVSGASWTVDPARPQATLFLTLFGNFSQQILTHFLSPDTNPNQFSPSPLPFGSPTWQSSLDSSEVWGNKLTSIAAGSDPTCPNTGSIPCLLLQAIGSVSGPTGFGIMTHTTYIQRLNTTGGSAPSTGCSLSTDVGAQMLVPYSADYYFYTAQN
jgi:hypothetical protein